MDYKAISKAITDPENQPHQWNDQELAEFFVSAADEIERLQEALRAINRKNDNPAWFNPDIHEIVETALQQKESE